MTCQQQWSSAGVFCGVVSTTTYRRATPDFTTLLDIRTPGMVADRPAKGRYFGIVDGFLPTEWIEKINEEIKKA